MFVLSILSTLFVPLFLKWYEAQTGVYPLPFIFVLVIGGIINLFAIFTDDFKGGI
jgi:lipid-A-disaccharide synthase-like uncharacterized protein